MTTAGRDEEPEKDDRRRDRIVLLVLKGLARLAWMIPWPVWRALASVLGFVAMFTRRRQAVLANVRHARHANPPHPIAAWRIGSGQPATHFRVVIGTLRAGELSPPAQAADGYLVFLCEDREDTAERSLAEVRALVLAAAQDQKRQRLFADWLDEREKKATVEVASYYGKWDSERGSVN